MQVIGASAVAVGTPFGKVCKGFASREKEMNILCWEGYNPHRFSIPSVRRRVRG